MNVESIESFSKRIPPWSLQRIQRNASVLSTPIPGVTFYVDPAGDLQVGKRWFYQRWFGPGDATASRVSAVALTTLRLVLQAVECEYLRKDRIAEHNGIWMDNREFLKNICRNIPEPHLSEYFVGNRKKSDHELTEFQLNSKKIHTVFLMLSDGFEYYTNTTVGALYEMPDEEATTDVMKWLSVAEEKLPDRETELNNLRVKIAEASTSNERQELVKKYYILCKEKWDEEGEHIQIQSIKYFDRVTQHIARMAIRNMRAQLFGDTTDKGEVI